jgi:putative FmdB family regulatory protein
VPEEVVPTYQYVCTDCGGQVEAVQKFTDNALTVHDDCGGKLRKVYSAVGIVFKGSGFYRTDSRSGPGSSLSASSSADSGSSGAASSDSGSSSSAESGKSGQSDKGGSDKKAASAPASASGSSGKASEKVA